MRLTLLLMKLMDPHGDPKKNKISIENLQQVSEENAKINELENNQI